MPAASKARGGGQARRPGYLPVKLQPEVGDGAGRTRLPTSPSSGIQKGYWASLETTHLTAEVPQPKGLMPDAGASTGATAEHEGQ